MIIWGGVLSVLVAIILGVSIHFSGVSEAISSISRAIGWLPFFIVGYYLDNETITSLRKNTKIQVLAVLIILFSCVLTVFGIENIKKYSGFLYQIASYETMGLHFSKALIAQLLYYLVASSIGFSLLILIPNKRFVWSYIGSRTLAILIFHRIIREIIQRSGIVYEYFSTSSVALLSFCIAASLIITLLCSNSWFSRIVKKPFAACKGTSYKK